MNNQFLESIGLSLVHSLWQGAIILFLVLLGLVAFRNRKARARYAITLIGTFALPIILTINLLYFWPEQYVDNSSDISPSSLLVETVKPTDFQEIINNPQSSSTLLWIQENASAIAQIWLVGMALFLIKILGSFLWMKRLTQKAIGIKNPDVISLLREIRGILDIKRAVQVKLSSWLKSPVILGFFRPTVLFPIGLIEGLTSEEVEAILYHELAHLKRNDFVINIIINVLQIVFFYHPAYWWLKSQLDNEREYATDELALEHSEKKLPMIKALAKVQAYGLNQSAMAFAGNSKNQVLKRINIMMNSKQQPNWLSALFTIILLLGAFALMSVQEQNSVEEKSDKKEVQVDLNTKMDSVKYWSVNIPILKNEPTDSSATTKQYWSIPEPSSSQDTVEVSQAIVDLVQNRASFEVEYDLKGQIKSISKEGKELTGKTIDVYKTAWNQIEELNAKTNQERTRQLRSEEQRLLEQRAAEYNAEIDARLEAIEDRNKEVSDRVQNLNAQQLAEIEAQYNQLQKKLEEVQYVGNRLDEEEVDKINEYKSQLRKLEDEMLANYSQRFKNQKDLEEALVRKMEEVKKSMAEKSKDSRMILPGGEANKGILNVMLQPYSKKESSTLYILDGRVLTNSDELENQIELLRSIQIVSRSPEGLKDFFGRDLEGKSTIIKLSTREDFDDSSNNPKVQFILNDSFEIETILIDNIEVRGEEREKALREYRRHREREFLSREKTKLKTIIQAYENQGMTNGEIKSLLMDAYEKDDLLTARISDNYKFIRENRNVSEIKYASVGVSYQMDSLSIHHILGDPTQSVFYLNDKNRETIYNNIVSKLKKSGTVMIELNGKLKKSWALKDLDKNVDVESINQLALVKGDKMYRFHSKRKLGETTALLRVTTKN